MLVLMNVFRRVGPYEKDKGRLAEIIHSTVLTFGAFKAEMHRHEIYKYDTKLPDSLKP